LPKKHINAQPDLVDDDGVRLFFKPVQKKAEKTRTKIKRSKSLDNNAVSGIVVSPAGPKWWVKGLDASLLCTVSGTVDCSHTSTMVAVGDRVWVVPLVEDEGADGEVVHQNEAMIVKVEPRSTLLSRKAAGKQDKEQVLVANVNQLCVVVSTVMPTYNKRLIDRYLIAADKGDLRPIIVVNKTDLLADEFQQDVIDDFDVYANKLGIPVLMVSAAKNTGIEELEAHLTGAETLFSGPSGVGKSSLINRLTKSNLRIGDISEYYEKGTHTTTGALRIELPCGGAIVDSPGLREFAIWDLDPQEVQFYFEEFIPYTTKCRFTSCTHTHEPDCAVKEAVDNGELDVERYLSYMYILHGNADEHER